jgi:hypothetical protein
LLFPRALLVFRVSAAAVAEVKAKVEVDHKVNVKVYVKVNA